MKSLFTQPPFPHGFKVQKDQSWYRLDNAGKIYPALLNRRYSSLFRLSLDLKETVSLPLLQQAIKDTMPRFPYYQVSLKPGLFWYYLESNPSIPPIEGDSLYPCMSFPLKKKGMFLFRIRIFRSRIAVEFSHILSDGTGALVFLKTLTAQYLRLKGIAIPADTEMGVMDLAAEPDSGEFEDAFQKYFKKELPRANSGSRAYHLKDPLLPRGQYYVITGIMSLEAVRARAVEYKISIGEFLVAQLIDSFQKYLENREGKDRKKAIRMNVPVNLRTLYPSNSMRNFFLSVEPWIDPRLGQYTFQEICGKVHHYMGYELDRKFLNQQITRNVKGELNMINRLFPLHIKNIFMPGIYRLFGENNYSSGFSNLGRIQIPESMARHIDHFDFYPPPGIGVKIKAAALSFGDELRISFGSLINNTELERLFFTELRKKGISVRIESNHVF